MKRFELDAKERASLTAAELRRLDATLIDYSDIPALSKEFFATATRALPAKQQLTIRLDSDVLDWLRTPGRGYQTRINRILRAVMECESSPNITQTSK